jgi:hypothetical protein
MSPAPSRSTLAIFNRSRTKSGPPLDTRQLVGVGGVRQRHPIRMVTAGKQNYRTEASRAGTRGKTALKKGQRRTGPRRPRPCRGGACPPRSCGGERSVLFGIYRRY